MIAEVIDLDTQEFGHVSLQLLLSNALIILLHHHIYRSAVTLRTPDMNCRAQRNSILVS